MKTKYSKEEMEFWIKIWQQPYNQKEKYNRSKEKRKWKKND
jgi:hypothetical protein